MLPSDLLLEADPPAVVVQAAFSKHRRRDVQEIGKHLADELRPWLLGKAAGKPVFKVGGKPHLMFREDLAAAGIEHVDADGRYCDLYALATSTARSCPRSPTWRRCRS